MNELKSRIKQRIDTTDNWESKNPILLNGELGFVSDGNLTGSFKVGDGISSWNDLKYSFNETNLINISTVSSSIQLDKTYLNKLVFVSNTCNITVSPIYNNFNCIIKNISSGIVTIVPSNILIDNESSNIILNKNEFIQIVQFENNFYIINTNKIYIYSLGDLSVNDFVLSSK